MARIIEYFIFHNPKENYMESEVFEAVILISFRVATIQLIYSLSFMVSTRLGMDVEFHEDKYSKVLHASPYVILTIR